MLLKYIANRNHFYMYLAAQTNLYATQYLEAHPDLPPHSHYRHWQPVSMTEMKQFRDISRLNLTAVDCYGCPENMPKNIFCSKN